MLNLLKEAVSCKALTAAMAIAAGGIGLHAHGEDIALGDHSFEDLDIRLIRGVDDSTTPDPRDVALPVFQAELAPGFVVGTWQETGSVSSDADTGFEGLLDAGIFLNIPTETSGIPLPAVPNADGDQVAFMRFNVLAGTVDDQTDELIPATTISQQTSEFFQGDSKYTFTMGIGSAGVLSIPGSTQPETNPYTAILRIGYYDDGATAAGGFTSLADEVINITELLGDGTLTIGGDLEDFSVMLTTDSIIDPTLASKQLVVLVEQAGGTTGSINLDNARLSRAVVPEPTSLALLGVAGVMVLRRRR